MTINLVACFAHLLDVVFFTRTNVRLGIPDHAFAIGSGAISHVLGQWQFLPGIVIISQLCPKGMEATMYALLAGCHNLGASLASNFGAFTLVLLRVQPNGDGDDTKHFNNLWLASLLSTMLPMLTLLLLPWLVPDAKQTDKLLPDGDQSATKDSLLRR